MAIKACVVSDMGQDSIRHSVEVTAEALYEAAVLGIKATHPLRGSFFDVRVKAPTVRHSASGAVLAVSGVALAARLVQNGKSPREHSLKLRRTEILKCSSRRRTKES